MRFFAPTPAHWFACADPPPQIVTRPPEAAVGAPLMPYLASGPDAARWRRWQSELQMLFFEHAVNRRREASRCTPVDGLWFWGGGTLAPPATLAPRASATSATTLPSAPEAPVTTTTFPCMMDLRPTAQGSAHYRQAKSICNDPQEPPQSFQFAKIRRTFVSGWQKHPATSDDGQSRGSIMMRHLSDHGLPLVQLKEQRRDLVVAMQNRIGPVSGWELMQIAAVQQAISAFEDVIADLDAEMEAAA